MTKPRFYTSSKETPERNAMAHVAVEQGFTSMRLPYRITGTEDSISSDRLYGGVLWCETLASQLGMSLHETPLDWLVHQDASLLGRHVDLVTVREVWDKPRMSSRSAPFYKPLDGKRPEPGIYLGTEMPGEPEQFVMRQGVLDIVMEARAFVLDGEIRTASIYSLGQDGGNRPIPFVTPFPQGGQLDCLRYLTKLAAETSAPATVIDFALTRENQWVVLEQNAPWCSALYGCDAAAAFDVARRSINQGRDFVRPAIELDFHDDLL